jgi:hypothetical protein
MPQLFTLRDYINATLDANYNRITRPMFQQIAQLSQGQGSRMQAALRELDEEAERLQEDGIQPDNAVLAKSLDTFQNEMTDTEEMILANGAEIEQSGKEVAPLSVAAKLFTAVTTMLIARGSNPLKSQGAYEQAIEAGNIGFSFPETLDFVESYVTSQAWIDRMEGWGEGYAELIGNTLRTGVGEGWSPIRIAREMRRYAENIPKYATENITRTLQLHSYRDASAAMELLNGRYIERKIRISALASTSCAACIARHGEEMEVGQPVDDHYNGYCDAILIPIGGSLPESMQALSDKPGERNFVPFATGPEWFAGLPEDKQRQMLGPGRFELYQNGTPLSEFWHTHTDSVFGDMPVVKPIKDIVNE